MPNEGPSLDHGPWRTVDDKDFLRSRQAKALEIVARQPLD